MYDEGPPAHQWYTFALMAGLPQQTAPIQRYQVLRDLAQGGMGRIYVGKKLGAAGFEREVVLKQLLPEYTQQEEFIELFRREATLSASLDHANIVHTIDFVKGEEGHFIVMEHLPGADLRALLKKVKRRKKRFSPAAALYIAREVLAALQYAHNKIDQDGKPLALIHRDISPSNILVSKNGEVKLTDFGIAKASTHSSIFYQVKGKVAYMSPEQARNSPLDHRSDLYSVAVCFYEILTGERLFVHAGITVSPEVIYSQPIEPVSEKVPGLPAELDSIMARALAVDREHRYQSAREFREALGQVAHASGLMFSTSDLARHLREICGSADHWRDLDRMETVSDPGGTEIVADAGGDGSASSAAELDEENDQLISLMSQDAGIAVVGSRELHWPRARPPVAPLGGFKNLELTSLINLNHVSEEGAEPLVDLDDPGAAQSLVDLGAPEPLGALEELGAADKFPDAVRPAASPATAEPRAPGKNDVHAATDAASTKEDGERPTWQLCALIVLLGFAVAIAIGLSGPAL